MGGAMAGSAICSTSVGRDSLDIVTLTINNICNLDCPHCYLQYSGGRSLIDQSSIELIMKSDFRHLCLVGKEPIANLDSVECVSELVDRAAALGKTTSLITNGLNLNLLSASVLCKLSWIDVSIDGSRQSYEAYRGGSYERLMNGVRYALTNGLSDLRVLHTISSGNIGNLREMLLDAFDMGSGMVVISPFQATRAARSQSVEMVEPGQLLRALLNTGMIDDHRLRLIFDPGYLRHFDHNDVVRVARDALGCRFIYVSSDPIDRGLIRVTYDGLVLTPLEAINTAEYCRLGRPLREHNLNDWFTILRREHQDAIAVCH